MVLLPIEKVPLGISTTWYFYVMVLLPIDRPQHDFSKYRHFISQKPLNYKVLWVSFNTKVSLEKLQKFALTSLDLP